MGTYYYDYVRGCYVDENGNRIDYADMFRTMYESGHFRPGGSMSGTTSSYGYGRGYPAYVMGGENGARAGYKWVSFATVRNVAGQRDTYGFVYSGYELGIVSIQVPDMEAWMKASSFWIGSASTAATIWGKNHIYNELWHQTKTRGVSTSLNKGKWNNPGAKYWRNMQTKPLQGVRNVGKSLGFGVGGALVVADIAMSGEVKPSHIINGISIGLSFSVWGSLVAGAWFVADYGTLGVNYLMGNGAVGLGDIIDGWYGEPLIEMYDGLY
jgi:hypothetical protein